jgi:hypothetical protein
MVDTSQYLHGVTVNAPNGRGCGKRKPEKIYFGSAFDTTGNGVPVEKKVIDSVIPWGAFNKCGFTPYQVHRGARPLPRGDGSGIIDVVITVGRRFGGRPAYLAAWDFIEEVIRFGASRGISKTFPFEKLTPRQWSEEAGGFIGSRMIFLHVAAYPIGYYELAGGQDPPVDEYCTPWTECQGYPWGNVQKGYHPKGANWGLPMEKEPTPCAHALRNLSYFQHAGEGTYDDEGWDFTVNMPSFSYTAAKPLYPVLPDQPEFGPGLFLALPITGIEFAKKADEEQQERLENLGFQVAVLPY